MMAEPLLKTISRAAAWALLACLIISVLSGWGITQTGLIYNLSFGLIDRRTANAIHRATNMPLAIFFLVHVMVNIKIVVSGKRPSWAWPVNIILILIGAFILVIVAYLEYFRRGG